MAEYRTKTQCNAIRELSEACADEYSTRERWRKKSLNDHLKETYPRQEPSSGSKKFNKTE